MAASFDVQHSEDGVARTGEKKMVGVAGFEPTTP